MFTRSQSTCLYCTSSAHLWNVHVLCGIHTKLLILIVLKESNIEWQDGLHQTTPDLTVYQTYCNLLHGQH